MRSTTERARRGAAARIRCAAAARRAGRGGWRAARPFASAEAMAAVGRCGLVGRSDGRLARGVCRASANRGDRSGGSGGSGRRQVSWSERGTGGRGGCGRARRGARLAEANREYEARFGYIFIVCATGKTAGEMLAILERRLRNDPGDELQIAAEEQRQITRLAARRSLSSRRRMPSHDHDTRARHRARRAGAWRHRHPRTAAGERVDARSAAARPTRKAASTSLTDGPLVAGHLSPDVRHRRLPPRAGHQRAVLSRGEDHVQRARPGRALSRAAAPQSVRLHHLPWRMS